MVHPAGPQMAGSIDLNLVMLLSSHYISFLGTFRCTICEKHLVLGQTLVWKRDEVWRYTMLDLRCVHPFPSRREVYDTFSRDAVEQRVLVT